MSTFNSLPGRALDIAQSLGDSLKTLTPKATSLLDAGAKLGALRAGTKVATVFLRRNPAVLAASVAAGGLIWYAAHRRKKQQESEGATVEGSARRVDARRASSTGTKRRTGTSRTRASKSTSSKASD